MVNCIGSRKPTARLPLWFSPKTQAGLHLVWTSKLVKPTSSSGILWLRACETRYEGEGDFVKVQEVVGEYYLSK